MGFAPLNPSYASAGASERRFAREVMNSGGSGSFYHPLFKDAEPVGAVECRHLIAFRQGRVIEYRVDEVIDLAAERQYRLADVNQLARAFADDVDAEQLAGLAVEYQLQEPGDVAEDLPPGDLLVAGLADFVGSAGFGQLLLVLADHRDFGDRVDPVGEALGDAVRFDPEGMAYRQPALFHRGRGERREPDHVSDRIDGGDLGLIVLVDGQPATA